VGWWLFQGHAGRQEGGEIMEKRFCKQCTYSKGIFKKVCNHPRNTILHGTWYRLDRVEYLKEPSEINKDNKCAKFMYPYPD